MPSATETPEAFARALLGRINYVLSVEPENTLNFGKI